MKRRLLIMIFCFVFLFGCSSSDNHSVNYIQAKEQMINNGAILIDVRTQEEYDENHIDGAVLLTLDSISADTASDVIENKETPVIVYCQSGTRSKEALEKLLSLGYKNVYDLGSISNWKE